MDEEIMVAHTLIQLSRRGNLQPPQKWGKRGERSSRFFSSRRSSPRTPLSWISGSGSSETASEDPSSPPSSREKPRSRKMIESVKRKVKFCNDKKEIRISSIESGSSAKIIPNPEQKSPFQQPANPIQSPYSLIQNGLQHQNEIPCPLRAKNEKIGAKSEVTFSPTPPQSHPRSSASLRSCAIQERPNLEIPRLPSLAGHLHGKASLPFDLNLFPEEN